MKKLLFMASLASCMALLVAKDPNFSFKNKTKQDVYVKLIEGRHPGAEQSMVPFKLNDIAGDKSKPLKQGTYALGTLIRIRSDRSFALNLDDSFIEVQPRYRLYILYNQGVNYILESFDVWNGTTFYVKLQEKSGKFTLALQEGRFSKTTEGYSLSENVKKINSITGSKHPNIKIEDAQEIE